MSAPRYPLKGTECGRVINKENTGTGLVDQALKVTQGCKMNLSDLHSTNKKRRTLATCTHFLLGYMSTNATHQAGG